MRQGSLASRLRLLRVQRGRTLQEASDDIGIDRHTLSSIERGTQRPHAPTLKKIAEGYGVAIENLLVQDDLAEEPVKAPTSPKVEAPTSSEPAEEAEESEERREDLLEEERSISEEQRRTTEEVEERIIPTETLSKFIDFMNRLIEKRQGEIAKARQERIAEFAWHFEMEATDAYIATLFKEGGISDYVEGVNENRIMTSSEARERCEEFARKLFILQSLTREAKVVEQGVDAETSVESEKGVTRLEAFLHSTDPQREGIERSQGNAGS